MDLPWLLCDGDAVRLVFNITPPDAGNTAPGKSIPQDQQIEPSGTGTAFDRMLKRPTVKKTVDAEQNLSTS
jgi:hypothetical protein